MLTLGIKQSLGLSSVRYSIAPRLYVRRVDRQNRWARAIDSLINQVVRELPEIQQTPENSVGQMKWNRSTVQSKPYYGDSIMYANKVKISARELLDVLSGKMDQKRFLQRHSKGNGESIFSRRGSAGKMISKAYVENRPDEDDDLVVFEFSSDDPAVTAFAGQDYHEE